MEGWRNGGKEGREGWRARIAAPTNIHTHTHTYPWWKHNTDHNNNNSMLTMLPKKCAAALGEELGLFVCVKRETGAYFRVRKMEMGGHIQDDGTGEYDSRRNGTCIHAHGTKSRAASFTTLPTLLCSHT